MSDPSTIAAVISGAVALGEKLLTAKDAAERNALYVEFQKALIHTQGIAISYQSEQAHLLDRCRELEGEVARQKDWSAEREQYALREVGRGVFCQVHKAATGKPESLHKYCALCFERGQKSLMQQYRTDVGRKYGLQCFACKADLVFQNYLDPDVQ